MQQETITLTFGDCVENHRGMQAIGEMAKSGLSVEELRATKAWYEAKGKVCDFIDLRSILPKEKRQEADSAHLLVVRGGCAALADTDLLMKEQTSLVWDSKAFMYGRVVNKKARHNLCYSDFEQSADYEAGKGTVVPFSKLPQLSSIRTKLGEITGEKLTGLQCEGNRYYDVKKTYIGFHGDTERRIVVAIRLGADFPMHYQWYQKSAPVGALFTTILHHGDIYYMSEKAVGFDWKKKICLTLRHAAGLEKNVMAKPVIEVDVTATKVTAVYKKILDGYAVDYKESEGGVIPTSYIDDQLVLASSRTLEDSDFKRAIAVKPDLSKWEQSWFLEFLFEFSTIQKDYPM